MADEERRDMVSPAEFLRLIADLADQVRASGWVADLILGLPTGGMVVAAALAKQLGIRSARVGAVPVVVQTDGRYQLDQSWLCVGDLSGRRVLVVDDGADSGRLVPSVIRLIEERGGTARGGVLVSRASSPLTDFVAATCPGKPPRFFWEFR